MDISIVVEWDNAASAAYDPALDVLRALRSQAADLIPEGMTFEVLVIFAPETCGEARLTAIRDALGPAQAGWTPRLVEAPRLTYYAMKNLGARHARGDALVFLDSDVMPEPGWLARLARLIARPGIPVACGSTYLRHDSFSAKLLALIWLFPAPSAETSIGPARRVFANNLAIRREIFLANPFPDSPGIYRGGCQLLVRRLREKGLVIYQDPQARVCHPVPNRLVRRALISGRDGVLIARAGRSGWLETPLGALARPAYLLLRAWRAALCDFRLVGLSLAAVPAAMTLAACYYALHLAGGIATHLNLRIEPESQ